jgi:bifunctional DNA-binding transcriptional regulator/antitoxin component of YhaV-PrlF toxin-antitoxin module
MQNQKGNTLKKLQVQFDIVDEVFIYHYLTIPYMISRKYGLKEDDYVYLINNDDSSNLGKFIIKYISYNPFKKKLHVTTNRLPANTRGENFQRFNNIEIVKC